MRLDHLGLFEVQEVPGVFDDDELRPLRQHRAHVAHGVEGHAAVGRAVEVQGGLRGEDVDATWASSYSALWRVGSNTAR